jgi:hypothetical protein
MSASGVISTVLSGPAMGLPVPSSAPAGLQGPVGVLTNAAEGLGALTAKIVSTATQIKLAYDAATFLYGLYNCP